MQADRWVKQHKNLKGQQLTDAVVKANLPYDPSIISLIQFPTVLDKLGQQLDWTTAMGNAFLTATRRRNGCCATDAPEGGEDGESEIQRASEGSE